MIFWLAEIIAVGFVLLIFWEFWSFVVLSLTDNVSEAIGGSLLKELFFPDQFGLKTMAKMAGLAETSSMSF